MRFYLSCILLFIALISSHAQAQNSLFSGCSSAGNLDHPVIFNCDFDDTSGFTINLHYKGQIDTDFNVVSMAPLDNPPDYEFTHEAAVSFASNPGNLEYYCSAELDNLLATQSPKNTSNQFPPAAYKYASFLDDPQGDMVEGSDGNWLDLTETGMSYSDTRIFCRMKSVSGTYPQGSFPTYYAYSFGFMITSGADSTSYALVYANVPLMLSSGLYVLNLVDSSYTRIGNVSSTISGGFLHLACNFSELDNDPGWLGWPPPDGYIIPMAATLTAGLSEQFANDATYPAYFEPKTSYLNFDSNTAPELISPVVSINIDSSLSASVIYLDSDNNIPITRKMYFDSVEHLLSSGDHIYSDSSVFSVAIDRQPDGWHYYQFEFSDGASVVMTPFDSLFVSYSGGCPYVLGDINGNGIANGIDVTYGVSYLKGGNPPPIVCSSCPQSQPFFAAADVNGSCGFNGIDITYYVTYLKGGPGLHFCITCPPTSALNSR